MTRLQTASLIFAFGAILQAQGPPSGAGNTIQSLAADLAALSTRVTAVEGRVTNLEARATSLEGRATTVEGRATSLEGRATTVEGRATSLEGRATSLEGRASKLEGQIGPGDLVGTYAFNGFQTELRAKHNDGFTAVSSYVFQGTAVLAADGTGTFNGAEIGHALGLFIGWDPLESTCRHASLSIL